MEIEMTQYVFRYSRFVLNQLAVVGFGTSLN